VEWSEHDSLLYYRGCIYVLDTSNLHCRIVSLCHDTKVAGHPGCFKTLELISRSYWWLNMSRYVGMYVSHCDLCLRTKIQHCLPSGELQPLPIPEERWDIISIDFISELPESGGLCHGYNSIMVAVNSVGKRSHLVKMVTTVTAARAANLYLRNVWKLPQPPAESRVRPQTAICCRLHKGTVPTARNRSHDIYCLPPADRQTDRTGQSEQYLQIFVGERQDDWYTLPLAEFSYNNHIHSSTQQTPLLLDTSQHPCMGFERHQPPSCVEAVNKFTDRMKDTLEEAKSVLAKAKDDMAQYYNCHCSPAPSFSPGDMVYLDSEDIQTTRPSKKLSHRRLGPYLVERHAGKYAYHLVLPPPMRHLHPVFNVMKLSSAPNDPIVGRCRNPPPPLELVDGEEEYVVEKILNSRMFRRKLQYPVKWEGYRIEGNTWEYLENLNHAPEKVMEFHTKNPGAPCRICALTFGSIPFHLISLCSASSQCSSGGGVIVRGTPPASPSTSAFTSTSRSQLTP